MSTELIFEYTTDNITCPPLGCGAGALGSLKLKDGLEPKSADGSGWLVATITAAVPFCTTINGGTWRYTFSIDDAEIADGQTVSATDILSSCCVFCDAQMVLDKLNARELDNFSRVGIRLYDYKDGLNTAAEAIENGDHYWNRYHSDILLHAFEVDIQEHTTGYPYTTEAGTVTFTLIKTGIQAGEPWSNVLDDAGDPVRAVVDPASSTPLTARFLCSPAVLIPGGSAFGVNIQANDPSRHLGASAQVDFQVVEES